MTPIRKGAKITVLATYRLAMWDGEVPRREHFTALAKVVRGTCNAGYSIRYKVTIVSDAHHDYPELNLLDEGVTWARGWSDIAKHALLATAALAPEVVS